MKKRKIVVSALIALCVALSSACLLCYPVYADSADLSAREIYEQKMQDFDGNGYNEFLLGSWITFYGYNVTPFEDQMELLTDSGINFSFAPHDNVAERPFSSLEDWLTIDELCQKYGLYYVMNPGHWGDGGNNDAFEKAISWGEEMSDYMLGYHLKDEPPRSTFQSLASWYDRYRQADPDRYPYVNLYPSYVGNAGLGGTYREYLQAWIDSVGAENMMALSHDFYPFNTGATNTGIFSDMEDMRAVAYENGKMPTHGFIQSTGWRGMRMPNIDEIRWNTYAYLSYGFKALSYFNYCNPSENGEGFDISLIMPDGTIPDQDLFDDVALLNWDIRLLGTELIELDTVHAYHTTSRYAGTEKLPENFVIRPDGDCDFVISLMERKDGDGYAAMIFNNSWTRGASQKFVLDSFSGADGLEYYDLDTGEWKDVALSSGTFTLSFEAGEGILLRFNGDLILDTEVSAPVFSLESGAYAGAQQLSIAADEGAEIYYTTDGSFPTASSARYTSPVTVGTSGKNSGVTVRAVAVRGNTVSRVSEAEYIFLDESCNVAFGADVRLSSDGVPYDSRRSFGAEVITDGSHDREYTFGTKAGKTAWATVDLGRSYVLERLKLTLYDNVSASSVIVQASEDRAFRYGVTTVFNSDRENVSGYGGESAGDTFTASGDITVVGDVRARYVRVFCLVGNRSLFTEIEVYNRPASSDGIKIKTENFVSAGNWTFNDGSAIHSSSGALSDGIALKDFIARDLVMSGTFSFGSRKTGFIGFEFRKAGISSQGVRVGVTPAGQVRWQIGNRGGYGVGVSGFNATGFTLRGVAVGGSALVTVNGSQVQTVSVPSAEAGFAAVYSGDSDMTVSDICAEEITDVSGERQHTVTVVSSVSPLTVELNTLFSDVAEKLPSEVQCLDDTGAKTAAFVTWSSEDYDYAMPGTYFVYGTLSGVPNILGLRAQAVVTVRTKISYALLDRAISIADRLDPDDYTQQSWANVAVYYDNALSVRQDITMPQNSIGVAANQLEAAINALVYKDANEYKATLAAMCAEAAEISPDTYTRRSYKTLQTVLARVNVVLNNGTATRAQVAESENMLRAAMNALSVKGDVSALSALIAEAESLDLTGASALAVSRFNASLSTAKIYVLFSDPDAEILACAEADLRAKIAAVKA